MDLLKYNSWSRQEDPEHLLVQNADIHDYSCITQLGLQLGTHSAIYEACNIIYGAHLNGK